MCSTLIGIERWVIIVLIIVPSSFGIHIFAVPRPPLARSTPKGEGDEYVDSLIPGEQVAIIFAIMIAAFLLPSICCWWLVRWIRGRQVQEDEGQVVFMPMTRIGDAESPTMPYIDTGQFGYVRGSSVPPDYDDHAMFPPVNFNENNFSFDPVIDDLPPPSFDEATRDDYTSIITESEQVEPTRGRKEWKEIIRRISGNRN